MLPIISDKKTLLNYLHLNSKSKEIRAGELAEVIIENLIKKFCSKESIVIDCGVADGRFLKIFSNIVNNLGYVLGFEPIPHIFNIQNKNFSEKNNVLLMQQCVSNENINNVSFFYAKDRRWVSSLSSDHLEQYDVEELTVSVTTIDDEIKNIKKDNDLIVSFIKLDIEGAEFNALLGSRATLTEDKPFIVFENSLQDAAISFKYTSDQFFKFFEEMNYSLYDIFGTPVTFSLWDKVGQNIGWNFVAIHNEDVRLVEFKESLSSIIEEAKEQLLN